MWFRSSAPWLPVVLAFAAPATAQAPDRDYVVLVASEAVDQITRVRFGPGAGPSLVKVETTTTIGINPREPDGPHGIAVSPDGRHYYVSTAHGEPFGYLWKVDARTNEIAGRVELGNFPATAQVTPDGGFVYVVNFNLHGAMEPSSVSVVSTEPFVEVARIQTCTMPHGSRLNGAGTKHYSACMMDDMVVEIDARELSVSRHFMLGRGAEHGMAGAPRASHAPRDSSGMAGHGMEAPATGTNRCSPTWAQPSADGRRVFVACNQTNDIVELDAATWTMKRRIPAGDGVYNLALTRDGTVLVATNKRGRSVSIFDVDSGRELARVPTLRRVVHGVAISADDRYAFVSVEGVGSEPGTLEVIDLRTKQRVASADLGQMAGGIDLLKTP
jgi:DNA-binding beta-propeller fold protein YncE